MLAIISFRKALISEVTAVIILLLQKKAFSDLNTKSRSSKDGRVQCVTVNYHYLLNIGQI